MYSNKKNGFSILDIIVKIIFAGLFIFILVWLFQKKVPNMIPFYSNVFRENIKYMQEAGESYFTDDKMPKNVGDTVKISLAEMYEKKLILPFVDEDGNSCNQYESYVSITKEVDESYSLKTNLVCNKEQDYTIKVLGCHTYCKNNDCSKTCSIEKLISYQYKKAYKSTNTVYSCPKGYKLNGKYCYKTYLSDTKDAKVTSTTTTKIEKPATVVDVSGKKVYVDRIETTIPGTTSTHTVAYACKKPVTKKQCTTSYESRGYSCNCSSYVGPTGKPVTSCSTCYETVPVETCKDVTIQEYATCYREETVTTPSKTEYSCPKGTIREGSGSNLKCYKVTQGSVTYKCDDNTYTLSGDKCYKYVTEDKISYKCDSPYKLEGKVCNLYKTDKKKATSKKVTTTKYKYTWSTDTSMFGWTKTGKTKTVNGKEICK